ncbi:sensor histidine kinase [Thalassotalea euphylliae]|uniref:histidine kinase n=1 Tax=Thalassotalea euphylliae TaxID=1655234 RepID=A0A3E0UCS9_9GAMM|nr:HAMP domain-containing sensor histidine kinase [Thalassotalea euphylliae]REL34393.1 sensor histidine kinase [Thalassotalea euphylliae]
MKVIANSLYQRLAISVTLTFALLGYLFFWWSSSLAQHSQFQAEQKLHIELAEHLAQDNPLLQDGVYDKPALENLFHTLMLLGPAFEFYFLDPSGKILTYSAKPDKIKRKSVDLTPISQLIDAPHQVPIFGDDPRHLSRKKIFSAAPVYKGEKLQGYLYVIIGGEIYDSTYAKVKSDQQLLEHLSLLGGSLLLLLILLLMLFRSFTSPIRRLVRDINNIRDANFDQEKISLNHWRANSATTADQALTEAAYDEGKESTKQNEVEQLGANFVAMVEQINSQFQQLKHNDKIRRELLAHLSHDLRTPLAAMKGYVETLSLKNEELNSEQRQQYINTALRNVEQLKLLIDQIFELAHLEDGQVSVNNEAFAVGELLHDIIAKFALKAQQKHINLSLLPDHCERVVYSDIAKLERILTNLIENALRHTPENGNISVQITPVNDKLRISVVDTGTGIHQKDLAYIFDARYRASNAQGEKNRHAGLGLAISKRLSQLLNSDLSVTSELGKGSAFSLTLAQAS